MGVRTPQAAALRSLCVLNYLAGSRKAQPSSCPCLQHGAALVLVAAWQSQRGAACSSSLLLAAWQSSVFPQPGKGGPSQAEQAARLTWGRAAFSPCGVVPRGSGSRAGTLPAAHAAGSLRARAQLSASVPRHAQSAGGAAPLDENHIYFTDTELHW